jgi:hypothetical protein
LNIIETQQKFGFLVSSLYTPGLPDFSRHNIPNRGKIYQMATKCTKWPQNAPNDHEIYHLAGNRHCYDPKIQISSIARLPKITQILIFVLKIYHLAALICTHYIGTVFYNFVPKLKYICPTPLLPPTKKWIVLKGKHFICYNSSTKILLDSQNNLFSRTFIGAYV